MDVEGRSLTIGDPDVMRLASCNWSPDEGLMTPPDPVSTLTFVPESSTSLVGRVVAIGFPNRLVGSELSPIETHRSV